MVGFTAHYFQSGSIPLSHFYHTLSSLLLLTAMERALSLGNNNRWLMQMYELRKLWERGDAMCCHIYTRRDPLSLCSRQFQMRTLWDVAFVYSLVEAMPS